MPESIYEAMTDHDLRCEVIKLAKLKPEPKGNIRAIQSVYERRYLQELAASVPDQRRLSDLKQSIDSIDMGYIQDYTEFGTLEWRGKHPFPPTE